MKAIVDQLLALYPNCKIVLHRPVWYSPNTYNGAMYLKEGLNRLQNYYPVLQSLVADYGKRFPGQVLWGIPMASIISKKIIKRIFSPKTGMPELSTFTPMRRAQPF